MLHRLTISTPGKGLHEITSQVQSVVASSSVRSGLCSLFLQHTSASLLIQENADPSVRHDLEAWLSRLVPERDPLYTHTDEGADDMPSHIRTALTSVSLSIPIVGGRLALGRWQGIYLWEHRTSPHHRSMLITIVKD